MVLLLRYARAAGSKDFMFLLDGPAFRAKLKGLAADTNIIVWGDQQLPLLGRVDDTFIPAALELIPEGVEFLILCLEKTIYDFRPHHYLESFDNSSGETHAELKGSIAGVSESGCGCWPVAEMAGRKQECH